MKLDVKFMESNKIVNEAIKLLANFLNIGSDSSKNISISRFLSRLERKRADDLISHIQEMVKERAVDLKAPSILKMPLSRMAKKLNLVDLPQRLVVVVDSVEKVKFLLSKGHKRNWKFGVEDDLKLLIRIGARLKTLGLHTQFVFVSSVHLDLGIPSFIAHFMSQKLLCKEVKLTAD